MLLVDLLVFFLGVGVMQGGVDKIIAESRAHGIDDVEGMLLAKQRASATRRAHTLERELLALKGKKQPTALAGGPATTVDDDDAAALLLDESHESIDRVLALLREERAKNESVTWASIWEHTLEHTKQVYVPTYTAGEEEAPALISDSILGVDVILTRNALPSSFCRLHRVAAAAAD